MLYNPGFRSVFTIYCTRGSPNRNCTGTTLCVWIASSKVIFACIFSASSVLVGKLFGATGIDIEWWNSSISFNIKVCNATSATMNKNDLHLRITDNTHICTFYKYIFKKKRRISIKNQQNSIKKFSKIYVFLDLMMNEYILDTLMGVFVGFRYFSILIFEEAYRYHWHCPKTIDIADIDERFTHSGICCRTQGLVLCSLCAFVSVHSKAETISNFESLTSWFH